MNVREIVRNGLIGKLQQGLCSAAGAWTFLKLYLHPVHRHELPAEIRVAPSW